MDILEAEVVQLKLNELFADDSLGIAPSRASAEA